ncbi:hypothetical protein L1987_70281 [Smallanthus sonchifolius]|uniref:Uncharacterized protein n=1 Tax=Smallanthus sonchifolius TaxID=185202 RepID=A0ACB9AQT0_9ASTR|nr:hypothetical protein L1987_70281 [Smallanthus sonchifolius]
MAVVEDGSNGVLHGKYVLGRQLGHGTFAKVYQARNLHTGRNVAMKVVAKEKVIKAGMMEQLKREISVMKLVRHPNIVKLHEVMASKSRVYFAMELVRGGELFSKIEEGRLREDVARSYFQQLISAVDFCHSRGVYHRDLKPENLLLDEDGNLKVTDFGLTAFSDHLRQDGLLHTTCGTPAYVAPEVIGKKGYDGAKADIWSCGVILYVLLAGFLPFHDENVVAMFRKIYRGDFRFRSVAVVRGEETRRETRDPIRNDEAGGDGGGEAGSGGGGCILIDEYCRVKQGKIKETGMGLLMYFS